MTVQYLGGDTYSIYIRDRSFELNTEEIYLIQTHNFRTGDTTKSVEDLEYDLDEAIDDLKVTEIANETAVTMLEGMLEWSDRLGSDEVDHIKNIINEL